jgi:hypothetical protein
MRKQVIATAAIIAIQSMIAGCGGGSDSAPPPRKSTRNFQSAI